MFVDCEKTGSIELYHLLLGCVVPRPIAWISSQNDSGALNLAPFSFFNAFSVDPPIVGIGIGLKRRVDADGTTTYVPKDTLANILATEEFVVNIVSRSLADKMNRSSGEYPAAINEFEVTGLTPQGSTMIKPPRVGEAKIAMECRLHQPVDLGGSTLVLGRIVCIHVKDEVLKNGSVDIEKLQPIGRLSGSAYCEVNTIFEIPRPRV